MQIQTPAKINTQLHILKKRKDGFHELYTQLVPVSLFDTLTLTANRQQGMRLTIEGSPAGLETDNLIIKAAQLFAEVAQREIHLDFKLQKQIPIGAGLGGGSGNAAGVLHALNYFYQFPVELSALEKIASDLGADIPFFLNPRPQEAKGRGEHLAPLPQYPAFFLLIVTPPFAIATAEAYCHCRPAPLPCSPSPIQTFEQVIASLHNQFETTLLPEFPILSQIKQKLLQVGAVGALVSGSGSSVFGIFSDEQQQLAAYSKLLGENLGEVFCCHTLKNHRYYSA